MSRMPGYHYFNVSGALAVLLLLIAGCAPSRQVAQAPDAAPRLSAEDEAFLDDLQRRTFDWFWETTNEENGLVPDRWPTPSFSSVAAVGFGLSAYIVGAERGWVSREAARDRTLTTLRFFWEAPQGRSVSRVAGHRGFFYHFLNMETGHRFQAVELSTIDTALLIGGVLSSAEYFDRDDPAEREIRALADSLYFRVDWRWAQVRPSLLSMGWHPESGFIPHDYQGYNEAMLLYVLALGSPTHPVDDDTWRDYTSTYTWGDYYGYEHLNFSPLFGHQYSHVWIDFRGIRDAFMREKGIDYFENSRRATLSQRAYAIDNPNRWREYGPDIWGLTASDGPKDTTAVVDGLRRTFHTYWARGASLEHVNDDGTLVPTALGGSVPFAPEETIRALRTMRDRYGDDLYTRYGFLDSFNPSFTFEGVRLNHGRVVPGKGWFDGDYLGIDQGPILLMIENYRSGLLWNLLRRNEHIVRGLRRAGFEGGWLNEAAASRMYPVPPLPVEEQTASTRIVVLGSSTAEGYGPSDLSLAWVNRYREALQAEDPDIEVLNLGRGGYTTYHILPDDAPRPAGRPDTDRDRSLTRALALGADAIIVNMPSNDRAYGFTVEEQLANFEVLRRAADAAGVPIWFTTTQPRNLDEAGRRDLVAVRDALLARYPDRVIDFWTDIALPDGTLDPRWDSGDELHLNDAAHALLFERVRAARIPEAIRQR